MVGQAHNGAIILKDSQVPRDRDAREESSHTAYYRQGELIKLMVM